jgi:hypothetical protein
MAEIPPCSCPTRSQLRHMPCNSSHMPCNSRSHLKLPSETCRFRRFLKVKDLDHWAELIRDILKTSARLPGVTQKEPREKENQMTFGIIQHSLLDYLMIYPSVKAARLCGSFVAATMHTHLGLSKLSLVRALFRPRCAIAGA